MTALRYDVLGIGNAIVDVIARAEDDFLVAQGMHKGTMALIDEARAQSDLRGDGAGGGKFGRLGRQHHRRRRQLRRARGLRRQGQGRRARPHLRPRHPRRRRRLRHAAGVGRSVDRALLHHGDAGRRAHHEHLSRRRAGPASGRHRRGAGGERRGHLSRRLSVGSAAGQGSLRQGRGDRARGRPPRRAHVVGCVLRRPLSRGISRSDPQGHRRHRVRQRARAAQPL